MKSKYAIQVFDFRHHFCLITPIKIQLIEEYGIYLANAKKFVILFRHRQIEMVLDGIKFTEIVI